MHKRTKQRNVVRAVLAWYTRYGRTLPWRTIARGAVRTNAAYRILLSEVMLQQTQVSRVLEQYPRFLRRFPTVRSLAKAKRSEVVRAWQGMGYNNRAVRLHECAHLIVSRFGGKVPNRRDDLLALPGIGEYTADAILSSVYGVPVAAVDVNVQRVLSRIFWKMPTMATVQSRTDVTVLAQTLLPKHHAYEWNQALMDLGATVCTARQPHCTLCPAETWCASRNSMAHTSLRRRKSEAGIDGVPNRIYRGRVIEHLRLRRRSVRADILANRVHPRFSRRHVAWFTRLLAGLEKDGLLRLRGNGSLATMYVSFA